MVGKSKSATIPEKRRFRIIKEEIGCVCCRMRGLGFTPAEAHHLLKGYRIGHVATVPLCAYHHRGVTTNGVSQSLFEDLLGPSLALNKAKFHEEFGSDADLLAYTNQLVAEYDARTVGGPG